MFRDLTGQFKTVGELHGDKVVSEMFKFQKEMVSAVLTWLLITQPQLNNDKCSENE